MCSAAASCPSERRSGLVFFFQAEDGIRDYKVTGVQTCALPIYRSWQDRPRNGKRADGPAIDAARLDQDRRTVQKVLGRAIWPVAGRSSPADREIGRASCRERV